jgi:hypothetical protein
MQVLMSELTILCVNEHSDIRLHVEAIRRMRCNTFTDFRHYAPNLFCKAKCYRCPRRVKRGIPIHASQGEYF